MGSRHCLWTVLLGMGLTACAARPIASGVPLLDDARFTPVDVPATPADLFALDAPMRAFLEKHIAAHIVEAGPARGMYLALKDSLRLKFDSEMTRNAREAFAARSGNCMSLVILTAAFAYELKIPVKFQVVYGEGTWTRSGDLAFESGHVNLLLGVDMLDRPDNDQIVIDFQPPNPSDWMHKVRHISENMIVAMYANNRAAETLASGDLDAAYAWARAAIRAAPFYDAAYNTLGVVYLRHGDLAHAENALRHALDRAPSDPKALGNLVTVLERRGDEAGAAELRARRASIEPYPPFYFADAGFEALRRGAREDALKYFERELRRMPYDDEVHFGLALARLSQGDKVRAREQLELALQNSPTRARHDIYAAKLSRLREQESSPAR